MWLSPGMPDIDLKKYKKILGIEDIFHILIKGVCGETYIINYYKTY